MYNTTNIPSIKWTNNKDYAVKEDRKDMTEVGQGLYSLEWLAYRFRIRHNQSVTPLMALKAMLDLGYVDDITMIKTKEEVR